MVAVQTELDARKRERPELEELFDEKKDEGFFIKNLENVQGDERDVIFFSVGYGPDQAGHMTMNFGPLNRSGGERRLNVAVTRARDAVKILASFRPQDIDVSRTGAKGVHLLRNYLEFAERGPIAMLGAITAEDGDFESPFEMAVATALEARGVTVVAQVGVGAFRIDLGIKDPSSGRYILGVECDGATYHAAKTARDRDRLRQQVLENLGWKIHRVWSTDWIKDPARELERILEAIDQAKAQAATPSATPIRALMEPFGEALERAEIEPVTAASSVPGSEPETKGSSNEIVGASATNLPRPTQVEGYVRPYRHVALKPQGTFETFRTRTSTEQIAALVQQCVDGEGPIHKDRVMSAVAASFGIERIGSQIRAMLSHAIDVACMTRGVKRRGEFLWPAEPFELRYARNGDERGQVRPIQHVPPEEIAVVVTGVLRGAFSMHRDYVIVTVARDLGYDRTGAHVNSAIGDVITQLIDAGVVTDTGGQIRLRAPDPSAAMEEQ